MTTLKLILFCLLSYGLTACSSLSVSYDYDEQVDFSQFKTYNWLPFAEKKDANIFNRVRFITAVDDNLHAKGLTINDSDPDLLIATHFGKERKVDVTNWGYTYAPNIYYSRYNHRHPAYHSHVVSQISSQAVSVYEYEQGTLILDFINRKTNQLVWRATAIEIINQASTPEKQTEKIKKAVKKILEHFPPQVKQKP